MVWRPPGPQGPPPGQPGWPSPLGQPTWPSAPGQHAWPSRRPHNIPAYAATPPATPPEPPLPDDADPFTRAEHETRLIVGSPWWPTATPLQRQQALIPQLLSLPDHGWWLHGAWARWYRWHPADSRWFLTPPPTGHDRTTALPLQPGYAPPLIPAEILPTGPDYAHDYGPPRAIAGTPLPGAVLYRLRSVMSEAAQAPPPDYPLGWNFFLHGTPSTIAVTWSTTLWCASVPAFDPHVHNDLLDLWNPHLAQPYGDQGRLRWLAPPPLHTIIGLYAERLRVGRPDAAAQLIRCMVMTAQALRDDPRFRLRATALLAMIEPLQTNPALDHRALPYGDQAVERHWRTRCPAPLAATLFADSAPGERFQLAFYDLATALHPLCGDPTDTTFVEPRHAATALLAADMAAYRPDLATPVSRWLDPELRALLTDIVRQDTHPLRDLWPTDDTPSPRLTPPDPDTALGVLSASAAVGFAWSRLAGGIPIPPRGFTVPNAYIAHMDTLAATPTVTDMPIDGTNDGANEGASDGASDDTSVDAAEKSACAITDPDQVIDPHPTPEP
ncbi:hypothetical protein [Actinomadura miaoliensis]|uniref:hypothetical protein n=1 Tax=Actinomadura miaoliensis TaxID=430685 RepID=UPI0031E7788C